MFHNEWAPSALSSVLYGTRWPAAAVQQCRHFLKRPKESISFQISPVSYYLPVFSMCLCVLAYWPIGNWLQLEIAEYTHKQDRKKGDNGRNERQTHQSAGQRKTHLLFFTLVYFPIFDIQITHTHSLSCIYVIAKTQGRVLCCWCRRRLCWCCCCCCKLCRCFEQLNGSAIGSRLRHSAALASPPSPLLLLPAVLAVQTATQAPHTAIWQVASAATTS